MQQHRSEPHRVDATALPQLTPKQTVFVHNILEGLTATDAYKDAYNVEKSDPKTIWAHASRLRHDDKVAAWLDAAKTAGLDAYSKTVEQHMGKLTRLGHCAEESGNYGAAVQAEALVGKAAGFYVEQYKDMNERPLELLTALRDLLGDDIARVIALDQLGYGELEVDSMVKQTIPAIRLENEPE